MSLRPIAEIQIPLPPQARTCESCGARLIAYLPRCTGCGAPMPEQVTESAAGSLEKAEGATRLAHLTDLHVGEKLDDMTRFDALGLWLRALREAQVDAVVVSGDLVDKAADLDSLRAVRAALERSGLAWHVVPGNHDVVEPGRPGAFEEVFGMFPRVARAGEIELLLVDSNAGLPLEERSRCERLFGLGFYYTEGRVGEAQLEEFERRMRPARTRVLVMHHHLAYQQKEPAGKGSLSDTLIGTMRPLVDADFVRRWAGAHGVSLVLHGHKHWMLRVGFQEGLVVLNGGRSTERPFRARLIDFGSTCRCRSARWSCRREFRLSKHCIRFEGNRRTQCTRHSESVLSTQEPQRIFYTLTFGRHRTELHGCFTRSAPRWLRSR